MTGLRSLSAAETAGLPPRLRILEYGRSGLCLNHVPAARWAARTASGDEYGGHGMTTGLNEQRRYWMPDLLGCQGHDAGLPHRAGRHGYAETGWPDYRGGR